MKVGVYTEHSRLVSCVLGVDQGPGSPGEADVAFLLVVAPQCTVWAWQEVGGGRHELIVELARLRTLPP